MTSLNKSQVLPEEVKNDQFGEELEEIQLTTETKILHEGGDPTEDSKAELKGKDVNDEEAAVVEDPVWKFMN